MYNNTLKIGDPVIVDSLPGIKFNVIRKYMTKKFVRGAHIFKNNVEFEVLVLKCYDEQYLFESLTDEVKPNLLELRDMRLDSLLS